MADGKIIQLNEAKDLDIPVYPVTKAEAVYLENGSSLEKIINDLNLKIDTVTTDLKEKKDNKYIYSSNEINTGRKFINGKPIYSRTFLFTSITNDGFRYEHNIPNIEYGWFGPGSFIIRSDGWIIPNAAWFCGSTSSDWGFLIFNKTYLHYRGGASNDWTNSCCCYVIEYTKTTD